MTEKRKSPRVPLKGLAQVELRDGRNYATYVANVSREGLGLFLRDQLDPGTDLAIKLFYENEAGKIRTQELEGQIKWGSDGFLAHGIALRNLTESRHKELLAYIESHEYTAPGRKR